MEEYTEVLKEHLATERSWTKSMFKVTGTIYRGVAKGRFTIEQGLNELNRL